MRLLPLTVLPLISASCAGLVSLRSKVEAQIKKIPRVGYLRFIENSSLDEAFRRGLRELGYVKGQNIRSSTGMRQQLRRIAEHAELVRLKVGVILEQPRSLNL